jgi:hypothetical protein
MLHQTFWEMTRKVRLFTRLTHFDALQDYNLFAELYTLVYGQQMSNIPTMFKEQYGEPAVLDMEKILAADDQSSSDIGRNEKAYFSNVEPKQHTLSKKLTLASVMSRGFVADRKLWHWIEDAETL